MILRVGQITKKEGNTIVAKVKKPVQLSSSQDDHPVSVAALEEYSDGDLERLISGLNTSEGTAEKGEKYPLILAEQEIS